MADQRNNIDSSDSEEEYHVYRLRIHDATKDDAGVWQCEVKDKYGAVSTQCDINIWEEIQRKAALAIRQASMTEEEKRASKDQTLSLARKVVQNGTANQESGALDDTYIKKFMDRNALSEEEPNFVQSLRSTKVEEGRDFRLTCYVSGNPKPEVKWFKNNIELVNDHRHRIVSYPDGMNFLEIKRASINLDSKIYRCEATSCLGISSTDARITVLDSKEFEEWDQHRGEFEVNIASIQKQSRTEGVKKVQIDDNSVSDRVLKRLKSEERSLHELYSKQRESVLKLNCRWEDCQQFFFKEDLKSKCLVDGAGLTLSCFVSGISPFFAMWYKDGKPLFNNVYERYHIRSRGGHLSLEIPCTTLDDTGEYSCEVRNEQGHIVSTCYVQVEPYNDTYMDYSRPYFAKNMHTVRIEYGGSATFSCICKGNPKPGLTWFKDGRALNPSNKITMHSGEKGLNLLKIHDADFTDIGLYKCEAHNMAGRCQSSAKLLVFGEPTPAYKRISFEEEEFNRNQTENFNVAVFEGEDMYFSKDSKDIFVKPPGFARGMPPTMKVKEEQMIFFDCRAEGFPRPIGQWFFNDQPIQENKYIRIIGVKNIHTLEIKSADAGRDAGRYTLKLKNEATGQTCYSSCDLTIVAKQAEEVKEDRKTRSAKFAESIKSRHIKDEEFVTIQKSVVSESINECAEKVVAAAVAEATSVVANGQGKDSIDGVAQLALKEQKVEEVVEASKQTPVESAVKEEPSEAVKEMSIEESPVEVEKESPAEASKSEVAACATEEQEAGCPVFLETIEPEYNFTDKEVNVKLKCQVSGDPMPLVVWWKDGVQLSSRGNIFIEWNWDTGAGALVFRSLSSNDSGKYECVASSKAGSCTANTVVTVKKQETAPSVFKSLDKEYNFVDTDENVRLSCKWKGQPVPTVEWFKDGTKLSSSSRLAMEWDAVTGTASLVFKSLSIDDCGTYKCVATSSAGTANSETTVTVKKPQKIPTATKSMDKEYNYVESETNVSLTCTWEGEPKPTVEWFKDGSKISNTDNISMEWNSETGVASLKFKSLRLEDSGSYECVAQSSAGTTKLATKMTIKKPDRIPTATAGLEAGYNFIDSDTNVKLSCKWDGQPMPTVEWFKDGTKLVASDNMSMEWDAETGLSSLVFKALSVDASGTYMCVATSSAGTDKCETVVTVKKAERIPTVAESLPTEYTFVDTDTNVCLKCKWEGNPSPTVEWFKDGSKLSANDNMSMDWNEETGEASLKFKSLSLDNSGNYECVATSPLGTTKANTNVAVKKPEKKPTVQKALDKEYNFVDTDTNVKLQCQVDGNPCPEITWMKDGKPLAATDRVKFEWDGETGTAALVFSSLTDEDSGNYECVAKSPLGTSKCPTTFSVTKPKKAPIVVKPLEKQYNLVETETNVRIECQIDGNPAPEISWLKDDMELEAGGRIKFEWNADTGMATLLLRKLNPMDAGKYECVASSSLGTTSSSTNVSINKPDKTPEVTRPLKKEYNFLDTDTHVKIECQVDGSPAPEITWLKDGQPIEAGGKFKPDFAPENGMAELVFSHLSPEDSGMYECVAKSRVGETKCATTVTVTKPEMEPSILQPMDREYNFCEGDENICVQCMMEGNPTPDVSWFKGGEKVEQNDNMSQEWDADSGVASLTFKKLTCADSGHYECVASSKLGTSRCPTTLNVKMPEWKPVIEGLNKEYAFVDTDTNVQIHCKISANPAPKVQWRKNGKSLTDCANISTEWNADNGTATLTFKSLTCDDSAEYECEASSDLGTTMVATNVAIKKPEKMPAVLKPLEKHYRFEEGEENVVISCTFEGNPPPNIAWTQNGKRLKNADYARFEFDPETGVAAIVFTEPLSALDTGTYECVATSPKGACKTGTEINVSKKEDFSPTESVEEVVTAESTAPAESAPSKDATGPPVFTDMAISQTVPIGGSAVFKCIVTSHSAAEFTWQKDSVNIKTSERVTISIKDKETSLTINDVQMTDRGTYTCVAKNQCGKSETSGDLIVDEKENLLRGKRRQTWAGEFSSAGDDNERKGSVEDKFVWDCFVKDITILAEGRGEIMTIDETDGSADTEAIDVKEESAAMETTLEAQSAAETAKSVTFAAEESSSLKTESISSSSQKMVTTVTESTEQSSLASSKSRSAVESRTESLDSSDQASTVRVLEDFESSVTKLQETLSQTTAQKTRSEARSSNIEIVEVSAVPVARADGSVAIMHHHHHEHHAPELIIPAHSQRLPAHSEIELMVKVKASKRASVKWLHDGKPVTQTEHYEMLEEEIDIKE